MTNQERKEYNINCANFLNWIYVSSIDLKENKYPQLNEAGWYKFIPKVAHAKLHYSYYIGRSNHDLKFDSDWNWIMEVINKAEDVQTVGQRVYFDINPFKISVYCSGVLEKNLTSLSFTLEGTHLKREDKKEAVISAINQFLIWYNKNK
jgi:hypothetical protein